MKLYKSIKSIFMSFLPLCAILILIGSFLLCAFIIDAIRGHQCVVIETGYFHSTDNKEKCHFISDAQKKGYEIRRISKSEAIKEERQICRECFSVDEINDYIKEIQETVTKNQFIKDWMVWVKMNKYNKNTNFDYLYVYMEPSGRIHIKGDCFEKKGELKRIKFSNIHSIESTCNVCVSRSYCDFIYKYINTGKYDISLIDIVE